MPEARNAGPESLRTSALPSKVEILIVAVLGAVSAASGAVHLGKGVSWDQKNYHHYDVYAWFHGLMDYHLAGAGMHSWMNPLAYVPQYWLVNNTPAVFAGALFGAVAGLNIVLVYILARIVLDGCSRPLAIGLALLCAAVGFWDPSIIGMLGTSDVDNVLSLAVLGSLCLLCWAVRPETPSIDAAKCLAFAGALLGLAAGLKWTFFVYAVGATLALVVLWPRLRLGRKSFLWFCAGGVLGYLPFGGYWNWVLWSNYGNPFFPYWNRYFLSSYGVRSNYRDLRFLPESLGDAVTYPFKWLLGIPTIEEAFRDARYALLFVLILVVLVGAVARWIARTWFTIPSQSSVESDERGGTAPLAAREQAWFLIAFFFFSFSLWMYLFAIQRYLSPLGLISGLMLLLTLDRMRSARPARPAKVAAFGVLAIFSLFWMQGDFSSWRVPYGTGWFGLGVPDELKQPNSLLVLLGGEPTSYVVAYLPESVRAVRLVDSTVPLDGTETALSRRAEDIISQHSGPLRTLSGGPLREPELAYLKRFGLALQSDCVEFRSDTDRLTTCALARARVHP
jgi:hypothetical protein